MLAGWLSVQIRSRLDEPSIEISVSLLTAFLAFIPAERLGSSGILAAVAAGLFAGHRSSRVLSPPSRLQMLGFWQVTTFLLESVLLLLIGLQLERINKGLHAGVGGALLDSAVVTVAVVVVRMAWLFVVPRLLRVEEHRGREGPAVARFSEQVVMGWSRMRGAVSLAAALAVPFIARGHPFPARDMVIFIAYTTIVLTLVVPGLTLPALVRWLDIGEGEEMAQAEAWARMELARAALKRIEDAAEREHLRESAVAPLRARYESRLNRLEPQADGDGGGGGDEAEAARRLRGLTKELVGAERKRLRELRNAGDISAESARRLQRDLDLEESRLTE